MWTKANFLAFAGKKSVQISLACAVTSGIASYTTHLVTKKKLETKYAAISEQEIREAREFFQRKNKAGDYSDPNSMAAKYVEQDQEDILDKEALRQLMDETADKIQDLGYIPEVSEEQVSVKETIEVKTSLKKNIFENREAIDDDDFDVEYEKEHNRTSGAPYILSHDEFYEGELDYIQNSLTYYEGDDVLADERDNPIRDVVKVLGLDNLQFGRGSKDKNIVYIRNDDLSVDFEVARSSGKFAEEVFGIIEHSDKPRIRKFRTYD